MKTIQQFDGSTNLWTPTSDPNEYIVKGVRMRRVQAYKTTGGKQIPEHWRPVRCCRSYADRNAKGHILRNVASATQAPIVELGANGSALETHEVEANEGPVLKDNPIIQQRLACHGSVDACTSACSQARNVDPSLVPNVPEYYPQNGEIDLMEKAISAELNVLLTGPTGCGKTHLSQRVCQNNNREMFTIQGGAGATYERIVAQKDLVSDGNGGTLTQLTKGILPMAMQRGAVLYLDEPNAIPSEVLFYLFSAMDDRRQITLETGEVVNAAKGFVVIGAMNEGSGYQGTALLNNAFRQRGIIIDMHYLPPKREVEVLVSREKLDRATAVKLVDAAARLRSGALKTPMGTRALLFCARLIRYGVSIHQAIEAAITNQVASQFASDRKAVTDVMASFFGLEVK